MSPLRLLLVTAVTALPFPSALDVCHEAIASHQ